MKDNKGNNTGKKNCNGCSKPSEIIENNYISETREVILNAGDATPTEKGVVNQSIAVADVASPDATDLDTALALVNELKAKLNAKLEADRTSGQQAT